MTNLQTLLYSITTNQIHPNELEKSFDEVAILLLRHSKLVAGQSSYLLKEIEFYFFSDFYQHQDPYVHSNQYKTVQRQREFGEWYFHRYKSAEAYLKLKIRGLDLTFGSKELGNYGGILIRKIQNLQTNQYITGPGRIVGKVIEDIGVENLNDAATNLDQKVFELNAPIHIEAFEISGEMQNYIVNSVNLPILKRKRHGLLYPELETEISFYEKLYCYFNDQEVKQVAE